MRLHPHVTASLIVAALLPTSAPAYSLVTSVSESCHEAQTFGASALFLEAFDGDFDVDVPTDRVIRRLMEVVAAEMPPGLTDEELFIVLSVVVGVRSPDTEGHSTLNLSALRRLHADPDPIGQYAHALRASADDGLDGDLIAIAGTKDVIRAELDNALAEIGDAPTFPMRVGKRAFVVDHYDPLQVKVALAPYYIGRALHALQDAHAHMLRAGDRYEHIIHVTNYIDAVNGHLDDARDGLAHSGALDDCTRDDVMPIAEQAKLRSVELVRAFDDYLHTGSWAALDRGLSACRDDATRPESCGWIEYLPACLAAIEASDGNAQAAHCCTADNGVCIDRYPVVAIAMEEPAGPYLGCAAAPEGPAPTVLWLLPLVFAGVRRLRLPSARACGAVVACALLVGEARAEAGRGFVSAGGHLNTLNDTRNSSVVNLAYGDTFRGGYRWGRWRAFGLVDRSYWVPLEFDSDVDDGVLNLGVGAEVLLFDDWISMSAAIGPSILLFDATFDDAGTVGGFLELRPGGFRWHPTDQVALVLDPITLTVMQPVLREPPIRKIHRRFNVTVEVSFL